MTLKGDYQLDFELHHRVTVWGRVVLPHGEPASGVRVELRARGGKPAVETVIKTEEDTGAPLRSTVSDLDGSFYFLDLPAALYGLRARHSYISEGRWIDCVAEEKVPVPVDNETASKKPAWPVSVTLALKRVDSKYSGAAAARRSRL